MTEVGLRARKKERTRQLIADTAARLFGADGFEGVTVAEVARAAEVSPQTVYNYFPTKEALLLDRDDEIRESLVRLVLDRAPGTSPAAALRPFVEGELERHRTLKPADARGDLPWLCATSPTVRRLALEARDRQADAVAAAITATTPGIDPLVARAHAAALITVLQAIVDHAGRRRLAGASSRRIAAELTPSVEAALDDLDRGFGL